MAAAKKAVKKAAKKTVKAVKKVAAKLEKGSPEWLAAKEAARRKLDGLE